MAGVTAAALLVRFPFDPSAHLPRYTGWTPLCRAGAPFPDDYAVTLRTTVPTGRLLHWRVTLPRCSRLTYRLPSPRYRFPDVELIPRLRLHRSHDSYPG